MVNGTCIITSQAKGATIGVDYTAERTPTPKKVIVMPKGMEPCKWEVEASPYGDGSVIKINGNYITVIDGFVYAIVAGGPPPAIWKIDQASGTNHIITVADKPGQGWDIPAEAGDQVAIKPVSVKSSASSMATHVFAITPA